MPDSHEKPGEDNQNFKSPNEEFEYDILHMGEPDYEKEKRERLKRKKNRTPGEQFELNILQATRSYKLEPRKPPQGKTRPPKTYDFSAVHLILTNLTTPATFTTLKKKRLKDRITATTLRQYVDALLTQGFITLADIKFEEKEYPNNVIPRNKFSIHYKITPGGRRYIRTYEKLYAMHSELYEIPKVSGNLDRL